MNPELEALIKAYDAYLEARDLEAEARSAQFELLLDKLLERFPGLSRELLRVSIAKKHRSWALQQDRKPPSLPPKA